MLWVYFILYFNFMTILILNISFENMEANKVEVLYWKIDGINPSIIDAISGHNDPPFIVIMLDNNSIIIDILVVSSI